MSYERVIGFGVNPSKPKGPVRDLTQREKSYFARMGVNPIYCDLKERLPHSNREPEQKIFLTKPSGFTQIRESLIWSSNTFIIPDQVHDEKLPLISFLLDSVPPDEMSVVPLGVLDRSNYTLRYRCALNPDTGSLSNGDFNEKSGMKSSEIIGGCIDRFERENVQLRGESLQDAFTAFLEKYRRKQDPAFCDGLSFDCMRVGAAYQAARNEIGVAFKHPDADVLMVFEACEDFWIVANQNISDPIAKFYEWEIELKQVWGDIPLHVQTPEKLRQFVYQAMSDFRDAIHALTPGSSINLKSKAEITKEHLDAHSFYDAAVTDQSIRQDFSLNAMQGSRLGFQLALMQGRTLQEILREEASNIRRMGAKLHHEKQVFNSNAPVQRMDMVGYGGSPIVFDL